MICLSIFWRTEPAMTDTSDNLHEVSTRDYLPEDAPLLAALFRAAILDAGSTAYSAAQCAAWAARADDAQAWAQRLGASSRTITRTFAAETGLGFNRWVTTARIQYAITLIGLGHEIYDAAAEVGYASASSFTTAFKRITGTTPAQFRAESPTILSV